MPYLEFNCLPTIIGSMPHTDPRKACALITRYLKDIPAWPQLPNRSFLEHMDVQYSEGFPNLVLNLAGEKIYVNLSQDVTEGMEKLYAAYLEDNPNDFPVSEEYAPGLYEFLKSTSLSPLAVKGQVTGPVTWGMTVNDDSQRAIIYDEMVGDAVAKFLRLKAAWMEKELRAISKNTIIFFDEPYMSAFGSVGVQLSTKQVQELLEEVFSGVSGLTGVHCCGNTDWSVLLNTSVDIINFDAYNFAESLSLYPKDVNKFLARNGAIAWGIIPSDEDSLGKESAASLKDRLEEAMAPFTRNGVRFEQLIRQGLITPSCGLAGVSEDAAERALELLTELSAKMRSRYVM